MSTNINDFPQWMQVSPGPTPSTFSAMKAARRWLIHQAKVPHYIDGRRRNGELDGALDTAQLATYEDACTVLASNPKFDGLGFALGDGWQGIDLDKITDQNAHLANLVAQLPGYVESSPSGNGVHAIGFGPAFETIKSGGVEAYSGKRYFTFTGSAIRDAAPVDLSSFVNDVLRPMVCKATSSASKAPDSQSAGPCTDGDYELALDALQSLSADCSYSDWVAVGMALSTTGRPDAFGHWAMWSATAPDKCPSSRELGTKWASFTGRPNGVGLGTLFQLARQAGWVRPAPDASSLFAAIPDPVAVPNAEADPFVRLDDIDDATIDPPAFTVDELLPAGEVTLLGAHGGVGKTALAQHIAVCLATGRNCLGKDCRKSRVLFYSAEDGADQMRWKFKRECERLGISSTELDSGLKLIDASEADPTLFHEIKTGGARVGGVTAEFVRLQSLMQATGCDVLIVDNASDVFAGDENNRAQVRGFIRALRTLVAGTCGAVLLLVHVDKMTARTGGSESYSGSTAWHNSVRSRLVLTADTTVADGLMLEQQKNNRGRKADPIVMQWVDGLPTFRGNYSETSTSDTDVMHLIAELVHEYHERGESLSTSQTAHTNAHKVLASDRKFPKIAKVRFWDLLREAERHLLIEREIYRTPQRKEAERWRRASNWTKAGAPSAPSAPS